MRRGDGFVAEIELQGKPADDGWSFRVTVSEGGSRTSHRVTLAAADHARLAGDACSADELVRTSFQFLLEREPKESILREFDLTLIARYFPEYEREIARRVRS